MEFILNKKLHSYRFRNYRFLPNVVVSVNDEKDIYDLIKSGKVKPINDNGFGKKVLIPFQEKKAKEGQLRIGVLRVGGIGDTLQLGAHAKAIRRKFSDCFITAYVRDKADVEVLEYNTNIDKIIQVGVQDWDKIVENESVKQDIFYDLRYAGKVIFNTDIYSDYKAKTDKKFSEFETIYKDFCKSNYQIEKFGMNLIDFTNSVICIEGSEDDMNFDLRKNEKGFARILEGQKYVTIHNSSGKYRITKSWDKDRWAEVVKYLNEKGYTVFQLGEQGEALIEGTMNLIGLTNIQESAWILYNAQFHLDTEGGLVHLAKAVKTPSIVIFGATPVESFGYKDNINLRTKDCSPCWYKTKDWFMKCPNDYSEPKCLKNITVDMVKKAVDDFELKFNQGKRIFYKGINSELISIVIPVYNQVKYLIIAINSILNNTKEEFELIIVDNGSDKEVKEYLSRFNQVKNVKIITNEKNLGFGKANNQGVKIASGEYICFLNSDIKVGEGWLDTLLSGFKEEKVGMTGASGGKLDKECRCVGVTKNPDDRYDYLEGWCVLIKKKLFDDIKGFDENFLCFSEDADLSYRIRRCGFKTKLVGGVNILHYANKTVFSQQDFDVTKVSKESSVKLKEKLKIKENTNALCKSA